MNEPFATCTIAIIVLTSFCSVIGFYDPAFREKHLFSIPEILAGKQYGRLITSAFLHADWNHLVLNMVSLFIFGRAVEWRQGPGQFLLIYFSAVVGGSLLSLWIHRQHEYRAYGASGGVCGMIFSYIFLFPGSSIMKFLIPIPIPGWLYAILFLVGSFVAMRRQHDNIGHDAHLGGAIIGLWTTTALVPNIISLQPKLYVTVTVLSGSLFIYLVKNPLFLPLSSFMPAWPEFKWKRSKPVKAARDEFQIDDVLEKISRSGMDSLTPEEKAFLNSVSGKFQRRADSKKPESDLII